jgi:Domain of unknown function (DUF4265)
MHSYKVVLTCHLFYFRPSKTIRNVICCNMEMEKEVKILFKFYSEVLEQEMEETMWAIPIDESLGYYQLDSLPFYISFVATDDIVQAEYDEEEEMLTYRQTIQPSGNSTVWVVIVDDEIDVDDIRYQFHELGCYSEALSDRYFSMEIKADANYLYIRNRLNQLKADGVLDFTEPYLSERHQY